MIQVDDNTKQTQLYENYIELVEFLHDKSIGSTIHGDCCLPDRLWLFDLKDRNPL